MLNRFILAALILLAPVFTAPTRGESPAPKQIQKWVKDLGSEKYILREDATNELRDAGLPAIDPLAEALPEADFEIVSRGVYLLHIFALSGDEALETAAEQALLRLAKSANTPLVRRAETTLDAIPDQREQIALNALIDAGATSVMGSVADERGRVSYRVVGLKFDQAFNPERADITLLKRAHSLQHLSITGGKFNDRALESAAELKNLRVITVKRAEITQQGVASLAAAKSLNTISLLYMPLNDESLALLAESESLVTYRLYGTKMTKEGVAQLAAKRPIADIDFRRGAFLGVGGTAVDEGCSIGQVHSGSAAAKAGLLVGDIIVRYNGEPVVDFESLKDLISENDAGDTVPIEIKRGGQTVQREITLGEWDM